jgi:hypothetical protein
MKNTHLFLVIALAILLTSCSALISMALHSGSMDNKTVVITGEENAAGLKDALGVGIVNAVLKLNKQDGYLSDELVKILLPPEAATIVNNIKLIPGADKMVNEVVVRLNRAAEDAAIEAKPIFLNAITSLTFADAWKILTGGDTAATEYLRSKTYSQLQAAFQPKIKASLDKKLVGNISTYESWQTLSSNYNSVANTLPGRIAGLKPVNANLDEYVTQKALDGLFAKVAEEEKLIRKDPIARVNDLLKKVFGQLDKK